MRKQSGPQLSRATKRVAELEAVRRNLARGVVKGAIPSDLAADEQQRISEELERARNVMTASQKIAEHNEDTLTRALTFLGRVGALYAQSSTANRRLINRALFDSLLVTDDEDGIQISEAQLHEPWRSLVADVTLFTRAPTRTPAQDHRADVRKR